MRRALIVAAAIGLCLLPALPAQEFRLLDRTVQVHGFASQGFIATNQNNWLSMNTSHGSFAFTDAAVNVSTQVTSKFHLGAQIYDRNIGELGKGHPELDWALGDYRFTGWFGVRGGKIKTALGLYTDTQDLSFIHPWAIMPQSIYPLDLRSSTMSHLGGDIYGRKHLGTKLGTIAYTVYAGARPLDPRGGYVLGLAAIGLISSYYGGWMHGEDLRWTTPGKSLVIGASLMSQHTRDVGTYWAAKAIDPFLAPFHLPDGAIEHDHSIKNDYYQYYGQYTHGRLQTEVEYRREWRFEAVNYSYPAGNSVVDFQVPLDQRSGYGAVTVQASRRLLLGTYFSWYFTNYSQDLSLPVNHVYDGDITARYDINPHYDLKLEGHFIDGYGRFDSVRGFYEQVNPGGLKPRTNAIVAKAGYNF